MRLALAITLTLALAAGGARAQAAPTLPPAGPDAQPPAYDPIGDAIAASLPPDQTTDMEPDAGPDAPATAPAAPSSADAAPSRPLIIAPRRPPSTLDRPVMIDEVGKSPEGPPSPTDLGYEMRIRASIASAQGLQGPLDGGWTVRSSYGRPVLALQLVDRGTGYGQLEGAWRSLDGPAGKVGLIDSLDRQPATLTIRITRAPGKPATVLNLAPASDGSWAGEIVDEYGVHQVTMKRN